MRQAYTADKIFTGEYFVLNAAVIVDEDKIEDVISVKELPGDVAVAQHAAYIVPAFIDIQIYGAHSSLFSVYPNTDTLYKMQVYCNDGGAKYFLPTIATNSIDVFKQGIDAINEYWKSGGDGVPGLHIEGPWINKEKRGAHIESFIHSPEINEVKDLLDYGKGAIKMITLAPESCSPEIIELIKSCGIIVSAGHSNSTYDEASTFFNNGITVATHLFNAMSALHHRVPGLPAAVMLNPAVMCSVVADGNHVDFAMINLAKKLMGERLFLITDAVTETKDGPYLHELKGDKYESKGILSGSSLTMMKAVKNCVESCDIPLQEALRMASLYPAKVLGTDNETGKILTGFNADLLLLNENLEVIKCI